MSILYLALVILLALFLVRVLLSRRYSRGRQVEFRLAGGSGTGEVVGFSWLRLRVRSLSSGNEHTVSLTNVRRR
ncbi:MAG TPA: hypothetical protein VIC05_07605 [Solirubrobacteraceae bacterium]|jgi:hypothetical protein